MPIQRKNYLTGSNEATMLVKLCAENSFFRDRLLSLLNLPFENRQKILTAWLESLGKEAQLQQELLHALELLKDDDFAAGIIAELKKLHG